LPLGLGLVLQLLAPRGSREEVWMRLRHSGQLGLVGLLCGLVGASALLVGLLAGPLLSLPFAFGLLLVGLPAAWPSGLRWTAVALTAAALLMLGAGIILGGLWADSMSADPGPLIVRLSRGTALRVWSDSAHILRDFPAFGSGMGSFSSIYPLYKSHDQAHTVALSSVVQWSIEAGAAGLLLLLLAGLWCFWRLPDAMRRVGSADGPLAFGLIGTAVCFALFSALHWSVELAAVAVAASVVGGTCDRWLAGGTDLFVDRV
jgi:hypothetical protein